MPMDAQVLEALRRRAMKCATKRMRITRRAGKTDPIFAERSNNEVNISGHHPTHVRRMGNASLVTAKMKSDMADWILAWRAD